MTVINGQSSTSVKITVNVTRNYGKQSIELGAEFTIDATNEAELSRAYDELYTVVMLQHKAVVERVTREMNQQPAPPPAANRPVSGEVIDVEFVEREDKKGKSYYKVKGGKFAKWGVRLWPDQSVLADVDGIFNIDDLDEGDNEPDIPLKAVIQMNGEKPVKVLRLYSAAQDEAF